MLLLPPFPASSNPNWSSLGRRALAGNPIPVDGNNFIRFSPCNCPDDPCWAFWGVAPYRGFSTIRATVGIADVLTPLSPYTIVDGSINGVYTGLNFGTNIIGHLHYDGNPPGYNHEIQLNIYCDRRLDIDAGLRVQLWIFRPFEAIASLFESGAVYVTDNPKYAAPNTLTTGVGSVTLERETDPILNGICLP